jgi:uncharacterized protein
MRRWIKALLTVGLATVAGVGVAAADQYWAAGRYWGDVTAWQFGDRAKGMQQLWRQLADEGDASAQYSLGKSYYYGYGEPKDGGQAAMWFRKAADQGDASAQFELGSMYSAGYGVPHDYKQAYQWFSLAASSVTEIGERAARERDIIDAIMAPAEIVEAKRLAAEWTPKPAK